MVDSIRVLDPFFVPGLTDVVGRVARGVLGERTHGTSRLPSFFSRPVKRTPCLGCCRTCGFRPAWLAAPCFCA
jgi:hypothetical protein